MGPGAWSTSSAGANLAPSTHPLHALPGLGAFDLCYVNVFYFPRSLAPLRVLEPLLVHAPLGGQYHVQAVRPA